MILLVDTTTTRIGKGIAEELLCRGENAAGFEVCYPQLVGTIQLSGGRRHVKKYIWSF